MIASFVATLVTPAFALICAIAVYVAVHPTARYDSVVFALQEGKRVHGRVVIRYIAWLGDRPLLSVELQRRYPNATNVWAGANELNADEYRRFRQRVRNRVLPDGRRLNPQQLIESAKTPDARR